jgi:hypothetical protein
MKHKKISLMAQKIDQALSSSIKKNQLFISNGSGVNNKSGIHFFNEALQPRFFAKKMT